MESDASRLMRRRHTLLNSLADFLSFRFVSHSSECRESRQFPKVGPCLGEMREYSGGPTCLARSSEQASCFVEVSNSHVAS